MMASLLNRHKIAILAALVVFCILTSSPAIASTTPSILQDVDIPLPEGNWAVADLGEYPMILNNHENYIDGLSYDHEP